MNKKKQPRIDVTRKNTLNLAFWTIAWVITLAISTFGSISIWDGNNQITIIVILINFIGNFGKM